jgi:hypothetical protein
MNRFGKLVSVGKEFLNPDRNTFYSLEYKTKEAANPDESKINRWTLVLVLVIIIAGCSGRVRHSRFGPVYQAGTCISRGGAMFVDQFTT